MEQFKPIENIFNSSSVVISPTELDLLAVVLMVLEKVFVDVLVPEVVQPVSEREALPRDAGGGRESPVPVEETLELVLVRLVLR